MKVITITQTSIGMPKSKNVETRDENCDSLLIGCSLFMSDKVYRVLCFVKKALVRITLCTLISHTNVPTIPGT